MIWSACANSLVQYYVRFCCELANIVSNQLVKVWRSLFILGKLEVKEITRIFFFFNVRYLNYYYWNLLQTRTTPSVSHTKRALVRFFLGICCGLGCWIKLFSKLYQHDTSHPNTHILKIIIIICIVCIYFTVF